MGYAICPCSDSDWGHSLNTFAVRKLVSIRSFRRFLDVAKPFAKQLREQMPSTTRDIGLPGASEY